MKKPRYSEVKLRELGAQRIELLRQLAELDTQLDPMIAAAVAAGTPRTLICDVTGYRSREKIRLIARGYGVEPPASWSRVRKPAA
jgi:hypothetical protein